jgi:hypothetical protein
MAAVTVTRTILDKMQPLVVACKPGTQIVLNTSAPVRGFHPVDYIGILPFRWIGPYPAGAIYIGRIAPEVRRFQVILTQPPFAELDSEPEILINNAPVPFEPAAAPAEIRAAAPEATSLQCRLNGPPEQSPAVSCMEFRLRRTLPEPNRTRDPRLVGLAIHAVHFL